MQTRGPGERGRKAEPIAGRQDAGGEGGAASAPPSRPGWRRCRDSSCWFARPRTMTATRMGRFRLVLAFCLAELMVVSLAQNSTTPYIAGLWEFVSRDSRHVAPDCRHFGCCTTSISSENRDCNQTHQPKHQICTAGQSQQQQRQKYHEQHKHLPLFPAV